MGRLLKIGEHIHNSFYNDKKQSLMINQVNEKYLFNDFGNSDYHGDVFDFASLRNRLNAKSYFHELLKRINSDFQLGLKVNSQNISSNLIEFKEYNSEEYKFWNKYGITKTSNPQLINAKNQKEQLFSMLPNQFTIKEAIVIGNTLSIKEDYVNKILRMPDLFKKVKRGYYEKK